MKKLGNMIQTKEQDKAPVTDPNEKKIYEFPDSVEGREVKVWIFERDWSYQRKIDCFNNKVLYVNPMVTTNKYQ